MERNEYLERNKERSEFLDERDNEKSSGVSVGTIVGGAVIGLIAVAVIFNIKDIIRYIKISSM